MGTQATDWGLRPLGPFFGLVHLGSWAADQGALPPRVSVVGAQSSDFGASQPGFRCVLGLIIPRSQSVQGLRGEGRKRPQLLQRVL